MLWKLLSGNPYRTPFDAFLIWDSEPAPGNERFVPEKQPVIFELFLGCGLTLTAAHLYRFSRTRRVPIVSGMGRAAGLLLDLPHGTSSQVLGNLEPSVKLALTSVMKTIARWPPHLLFALNYRTVVEVFQEITPLSQDRREAWLRLAAADPILAASICRRLQQSTPDAAPAGDFHLASPRTACWSKP